MNILHYLPGLPPVRGGGMIKYALDLVENEIKCGQDVSLLVPGAYTLLHPDESQIIKKKWNNIICCDILNAPPVSGGKGICELSLLYQEGNENVYTSFLKENRPDMIHIHSFMGLHIAFLKAAKKLNIPIVYTTHDFYGICPKAILLHDREQCTVTDGSQCRTCIDGNKSTKAIRWEQSDLYRKLKSNSFVNWMEYSQKLIPIKLLVRAVLRKNKKEADNPGEAVNENGRQNEEYKKIQCYYREMYEYVTQFHFNSSQTEMIYRKCLGDRIVGEVIPISNAQICDRRQQRTYGKTLKIGFIGQGIYKGFELLKEALEILYKQGMQDFECHVYFNPKEKLPAYLISHEPYGNAEMESVYKNMDVLVLPSIWWETYGLVVLEALSYGVPVIVSDNVGAKELLQENSGMGMIVKAQTEALYKALESIYCDRELLTQMNQHICQWNQDFDYSRHVQTILDFYKSVNGYNNSEKE